MDTHSPEAAAVYATDRPHPRLFPYYVLLSFLAGPGMPFLLGYLYFRYHTMRYRFDEQGVSMSWGILFRREINLTYARIQDIHLTSNLVERWLGLARIQVQTASGSSGAEMTIEGILEFERLRDFLYSKMRGTKGPAGAPAPALSAASTVSASSHSSPEPPIDDLAAILREVAVEVRALRTAIEAEGAQRNRGADA
ncbi:MAG TPA: PH domain-containing protein [Thermoanaerobaculia bacterium]|jgi:putative membrane protein|nr:PH domain-containing protein [Thermoanaerobaculia bacterium]